MRGDYTKPNTWHPLFGVPLSYDQNLDDGEVIRMQTGYGERIIVGTNTRSVKATIDRITREVFGQKFLMQIGMYPASSDDVKMAFLELAEQ